MTKKRVGYALGYGKFTNVREMAGVMKQAEERGFEMAFFSETIELMRDSVSSLTAIGLATKKLQMGTTQIVRLRGPVSLAQLLATIDELTDGRSTLRRAPAPKATHGSMPCRRKWARRRPKCCANISSHAPFMSGDKVSYHGKFVNFDNVGLGWKPIRTKFLFTSLRRHVGLKLAGEIGDEVILNAVCSPEYTVNALKIIRESTERAGRDFSKFFVAQIINCSIEDDHKKALDAVRWEVATKLDPVQISFIAGPKMRVGEPYIHKEDIPLFKLMPSAEGLIEAIPTPTSSMI
jgi:5,10-methylenetetrahydromethanopterin reductase